MTDEQLTPIRAGHAFDQTRLAEYLTDHLPGFHRPLSVRQFEGGQSNPTFLLDTPGVETPERRYVLRKKPSGELLPSAHLIEREYRVMAALADTAVPVPKVHLLCEDAAIIGTPFFVMDYITGRLLRDPALPGLSPDQRPAVFDAQMRTLAALHAVDIDAAGLGDYGKRGAYVARQIKRWSQQYRATETETIAAMDRLIDWLPEHLPTEDSTALVHGDYRIDNLLFHPERPEVLAVLDWELSTLGHPLADLAYTCMVYHVRLPDGYLGDAAGHDGVPTEAELVARYCEYSGRNGITDWPFYLAFSLFRYAAIVQGVHYRGLQGNASSQRAARYGALARTASEAAWNLVR